MKFKNQLKKLNSYKYMNWNTNELFKIWSKNNYFNYFLRKTYKNRNNVFLIRNKLNSYILMTIRTVWVEIVKCGINELINIGFVC